ncbi:MAG: hypothetical protein R2912_07880 [Eubacteriales bacterium]
MRLNENDGFCMRVRYYHNRIAVEFFHVLTDGTGGQVFLQTLVAEYLRLKYGANTSQRREDSRLFRGAQAEKAGGYQACIPAGSPRRARRSVYHQGNDERNGFVHIITGSMNAADVSPKRRKRRKRNRVPHRG